MPTINFSGPTSLGFFVIAGVLAWYGHDRSYLNLFAGSAMCWFVLLGPLRWLSNTIGNLYISVGGNEYEQFGDKHGFVWYQVVRLGLEIVLVVVGIVLLARGILSVA